MPRVSQLIRNFMNNKITKKSNIVANKCSQCLLTSRLMSKKSILYISFFVALVLIFYFVLTQVIPGFTEKKVEPISYVKSFSFIDQNGQPFTEKDIAGKVFVAEYFFTTCKGIC